MPSIKMENDQARLRIQVYVCKNCNAVLGNSLFAAQHDSNKVILLTEVEGPLMSTSKKTSPEAMDRGCVYHTLQCGECQHEVGKYYSSVTSKFEILDKKYALCIKEIKSVITYIPDTARSRGTDTELSSKVHDLAIMSMEAMVERVQLQESVLSLSNLVGELKQEVEQLKTQVKQKKTNILESSAEEQDDTFVSTDSNE